MQYMNIVKLVPTDESDTIIAFMKEKEVTPVK